MTGASGALFLVIRLARYLLLMLVTFLGLYLGHVHGPLGTGDAVVLVDMHYLETARNHTLVLGLTCSLFACVANLFLKIEHRNVLATLAAVFAVWFFWVQASDPDFLSYIVIALVEEVFWMLVAATPIVTVFWYLEKKFQENRSTKKG